MGASGSSDEELARRAGEARGDDFVAFELLVERHKDSVTANCRHLTRSVQDAEDLAQEVFVKAFYGLKGFEGRSKFRTWLHRIKINHCLSFLERREGRATLDVGDPALGREPELQVPPDAERELSAASDRERIARVLDSLPDGLRIPLVLCDVDQMAYAEIAEMLGLGLSAVKMRIKRAREEFRRRFQSEEMPLPAGPPSRAAASPRPAEGGR